MSIYLSIISVSVSMYLLSIYPSLCLSILLVCWSVSLESPSTAEMYPTLPTPQPSPLSRLLVSSQSSSPKKCSVGTAEGDTLIVILEILYASIGNTPN